MIEIKKPANDDKPIDFKDVLDAVTRENNQLKESSLEDVVKVYDGVVDEWASKTERRFSGNHEIKLLIVKLTIFYKTLVSDFVAASKQLLDTNSEPVNFKLFRENFVVQPWIKYLREIQVGIMQKDSDSDSDSEDKKFVLEDFSSEIGFKYGPLMTVMDKAEDEYYKAVRQRIK